METELASLLLSKYDIDIFSLCLDTAQNLVNNFDLWLNVKEFNHTSRKRSNLFNVEFVDERSKQLRERRWEYIVLSSFQLAVRDTKYFAIYNKPSAMMGRLLDYSQMITNLLIL